MKLSSLKNKKLQEGTFQAKKKKAKKQKPLKRFLIFWEMTLSSLKIKKFHGGTS